MAYVPRGVHAFDTSKDAADEHFPWQPLDKAAMLTEARTEHATLQQRARQASKDSSRHRWPGSHHKQAQAVAGGDCLRIEVQGAEGLPRTDSWGTCDPYVLVTAQSQAGLHQFCTSTQENTLVRACRTYCSVLAVPWHARAAVRRAPSPRRSCCTT